MCSPSADWSAAEGALLDQDRHQPQLDPGGPQRAWYTSGIRFGTPALTTRFRPRRVRPGVELVVEVLKTPADAGTGRPRPKYTLVDQTSDWVRAASAELLDANPLYPGLTL